MCASTRMPPTSTSPSTEQGAYGALTCGNVVGVYTTDGFGLLGARERAKALGEQMHSQFLR